MGESSLITIVSFFFDICITCVFIDFLFCLLGLIVSDLDELAMVSVVFCGGYSSFLDGATLGELVASIMFVFFDSIVSKLDELTRGSVVFGCEYSSFLLDGATFSVLGVLFPSFMIGCFLDWIKFALVGNGPNLCFIIDVADRGIWLIFDSSHTKFQVQR